MPRSATSAITRRIEQIATLSRLDWCGTKVPRGADDHDAEGHWGKQAESRWGSNEADGCEPNCEQAVVGFSSAEPMR